MSDALPPVTSKNGDWFVKSDYWQRWSRCLVRMDDAHPQMIELSVEPLNWGNTPPDKHGSIYELGRLLEMRVRRHRTHQPEKCFSKELPSTIAVYLEKLVGGYFYDLFIHEDLLSKINWDKYDKQVNYGAGSGGGGVPFILVVDEPDQYPSVLKHYFEQAEKRVLIRSYFDETLEGLFQKYLEDKPKEAE